jgi:glutathione S-transferase/RNA polymerase-associated protein
MAVRLFEHPLSPYVRKLKIVMEHAGIPYERVFVNPLAPDPEALRSFAAASPRLEVPCIVDDDGTAVFDSTVILEYLEDKWPDRSTLPASPAERARVRMLEELCDTELEAINWGLMEIRFFRRAEGTEADAILAIADRQLHRLWSRLDRELDGRAWMNGDRFGRGDAAVIPHITGSAFFGAPLPAAFARLTGWLARCAEIAAVKADAEQLAVWMRENFGGAASATQGMPVVRQYRDHRLEWMMKSGGAAIVTRGLAAGTIRFQTEFA